VADPPPGFEPPVITNPESPVSYPRDLYEQQLEGTVVLRLYVDARGKVVPESTRVAESSGYPALDSAAVQGVPNMRFAPARRDGQPVAAAFLQPVQFRRLPPSGPPSP
jgi:TonB family protein